MEALILSCGTGGGHNAAAEAIAEELRARGHKAEILDPYALVGRGLAISVSNAYIRLVQKLPGAFGCLYGLANLIRKLPFVSPVYLINRKMSTYMHDFLAKRNFDVIIMPHLFPAEIVTAIKKKGQKLPLTLFIATDYTCIPFTEETECDYYVIPAAELTPEFCKCGIAPEKLLPFGIPVSSRFTSEDTPANAKCRLGLADDISYLLISGGSMGAGKLRKIVRWLYQASDEKQHLIVICGSNEKLHRKLCREYSDNPRVRIVQKTDKMADYIKGCAAFFSKPGGLSSTEAAVLGTFLVHISPIPGCETRNVNFFSRQGMSFDAGKNKELLLSALHRSADVKEVQKMQTIQRQFINRFAAQDICDFIENHVS